MLFLTEGMELYDNRQRKSPKVSKSKAIYSDVTHRSTFRLSKYQLLVRKYMVFYFILNGRGLLRHLFIN